MLVDLLDGSFMGNPPTMEVLARNTSFSEIRIVFPANTSHHLLEASQLILEIFNSVMQNIQLCGFLAHHLPKIIGLENGT